jgi:predicted transcriptional regulator
MKIIIKTRMFKAAIEATFSILEEKKVLDSQTLANKLKCAQGTASKWLNRMAKEGILTKCPIKNSDGRGIGSRKYIYIRNDNVEIHYDYSLQQRLFQEKLRAMRLQ